MKLFTIILLILGGIGPSATAVPSSVALLSNEGRNSGPSASASQQSRISAYQNTHLLNKAAEGVFNNVNINNGSINNVSNISSYDPRRKKPVPLPRSKIPVLLPGVEPGRLQKSGSRLMGLGPRSKVRIDFQCLL